MLTTAQHAQHEPDVQLFEHSSKPHAHEGSVYGPDSQHAQQQHLLCSPVTAQHAQHDPHILQLEHSSNQLASESIYSPDAQHAQQKQQQLLQHPEGWPTRGALEGQGAQEDSGLKGHQGGMGTRGWQTERPMEEQETQRRFALEGQQLVGGLGGRQGPTKAESGSLQCSRHQFTPVLPQQQASDMYHVEPLPSSVGTPHAGERLFSCKVRTHDF